MSEAPIERGSDPVGEEESTSALQALADAAVHGTDSVFGHGNGSSVGDSGGSCSGGTGGETNAAAAAVDSRAVVVGEPPRPTEESGCFICHKNERLDLILLCDECDGEYHTFCVKPRLSKVPNNEWYCNKCKALGKGSPNKSSVPVSKYNGVYWAGSIKGGARNGMWTAKILRRSGRNPATIGIFSSEKEAAAAYDAEALRVFGDDHPPLNFPNGTRENEQSDSEQSAQSGQQAQLAETVPAQPAQQTQAAKVARSARPAQPAKLAQSAKPAQLAKAAKHGKHSHAVKAAQAIKLAQVAKEAAKVSQAKKAAQAIELAQVAQKAAKAAQAAKRPTAARALQAAQDGQSAFLATSTQTVLGNLQTAQHSQSVQVDPSAPTEATALLATILQSALDAQPPQPAQLELGGQPAGDAQSGLAAQPTQLAHSVRTAQPGQHENLGESHQPGQDQEFGPSQRLEQPLQCRSYGQREDEGGLDGPRDEGDDDVIPAEDATWVNISASGGQGTSIRDSAPGSHAEGSSMGAILPAPNENDARLNSGSTTNFRVGSAGSGSGSSVGGTGETKSIDANTHAGVETTQRVASKAPASGIPAVENSLPETSGVPGNTHIINAVVMARSRDSGTDTSADTSGGTRGSSQQSGSIPDHEEGARELASSPVLVRRKLHNGSPASDTLHGRKRVKTKWLQEYELDAANIPGESSSKASGAPATLESPVVRTETSATVEDGKPSGALPTQVGGRNPSASGSDPRSVSDGTPQGPGVRPVPKGKGKGKSKADGKKSFLWGVKDWCGHAASQEGLQQIKSSVKVWAESADGTIVGEDGNHFFCSACGEHGEVTCCDGCARVFHEECLKLGSDSQLAAEHQTEVDPWYCPACVYVGRINLVRGEEPFWARERREQNEKQKVVKEVADKSRQASKAEKDPPSPPAPTKITKKQRPSRTRVVTPTMAPESESEPEAGPDTAKFINIADAADEPKCVSRVKVFSPELDNCLLRSLLYDETYKHVMPRLLPVKKSKAGRGKPADPKKAAKELEQDMEGHEGEDDEEEGTRKKKKGGKRKGFHKAGTQRGESSVVADARTDLSVTGPDAPLGALTECPPLSGKAGRRPEHQEQVDGTRLGPAFGTPSGPSGVLDGTAVTFGARAIGPFRHGLAVTMVDVGLVPEEEAMKTGYPEIIATEEAAAKDAAEKAAMECARSGETEAKPFGSAKVEWTSRIPNSAWGRAYRAQQLKLQGGDASVGNDSAEKDSNDPRVEVAGAVVGSEDADEELNYPRTGGDFGKCWSRSAVPDERSSPPGEQMMYTDQGRGAFGAHTGRVSVTEDYMDMDQCDAGSVFGDRGAEKETSGSQNVLAVNRRHSSVGLSSAPTVHRDRDGARPSFKRSSERDRGVTRKENRRWNLKHIRAMNDDGGKTEVCSICRLHPCDALMVCPSNDLAKIHSFCFPCLETKESIQKRKITTGVIKWDCPTCRERRERPQRRAQTPASLRGAAWAGGGVLKSPCAVPSDAAHGKQSRGGSRRSRSKDSDRGVSRAGSRSRDVDRETNPAGTRGLKRSLSGNELQGSTRRTNGRVSPSFSFPVSTLSSSSPNGGGEAGGFRRDKMPRGVDNDSSATVGGSGRGGDVVGDGRSEGDRQPAPPGALERRRLLRMVATMALDRLQSIDSLNVLKDLVPDAWEGYAEAIQYPIDFSTIRRRLQWGLYESLTDLAEDVQLLCTNAMTFNSPRTVPYTTATDVREASERLWPHAQDLLNSLLSTEMAAAKYRLRGPASTSAAWPLDGPFTGFELTPANEDAYYMHVAIRRVVAAVRARADYEKKLGKDESVKRQAALDAEEGLGNATADIDEAENQLTAKEEKRAKELEKTAAVAASSPALLYTCGEFLEEESILRDSLSVLRATAKEDAESKRSHQCVKCTPIDPATLDMREEAIREMPTPVTRREVAPDGEFLEHDPSSSQTEPLAPNPSLEERSKQKIPASVVPEWRVLRSARDLNERNGWEEATQARAFQELFNNVGIVNRTRLGVGTSAIRGVGVFANEGIRARELVAEYLGERVTMKEAKRRLEAYRRAKIPDYLVRLDDKNFVDATHKGNVARFLNHSCAPNCYMKTVVAGKEHSEEIHACIFSLRNIRKGEEITYSYLPPNKVGLGDAVAAACACRAPGCRGRMSSREQL